MFIVYQKKIWNVNKETLALGFLLLTLSICLLARVFQGFEQQQLLIMLKVSNGSLRNSRKISKWKRDSEIDVFLWKFCEIFKNTFFTKHFWVTASDIRVQVVAIYNLNLSLQFVTINFTLSCKFSCWSMIPCHLNFYIDLFFGKVIFSQDTKRASQEK